MKVWHFTLASPIPSSICKSNVKVCKALVHPSRLIWKWGIFKKGKRALSVDLGQGCICQQPAEQPCSLTFPSILGGETASLVNCLLWCFAYCCGKSNPFWDSYTHTRTKRVEHPQARGRPWRPGREENVEHIHMWHHVVWQWAMMPHYIITKLS